MNREAITIQKSCRVCKDVAVVKVLLALTERGVFDKSGQKLNFCRGRKSYTVWFGNEPPEEAYSKLKQPIPDREALEIVEQRFPDKPKSEKYFLAQTFTLLGLSKPENKEEFGRMEEAGLLDSLIKHHNSLREPKSKAKRK
jgi:hypothetical protein